MSNQISVERSGNQITISGDLPDGVEDMSPISKYESFVSIDKIIEKCQPIMPNKINWDKVTRNYWFVCIRPDNGLNYSFPIAESGNRDNDFARAKKGIQYFHNQQYQIFNIGG